MVKADAHMFARAFLKQINKILHNLMQQKYLLIALIKTN
jgi:hypothetical protein